MLTTAYVPHYSLCSSLQFMFLTTVYVTHSSLFNLLQLISNRDYLTGGKYLQEAGGVMLVTGEWYIQRGCYIKPCIYLHLTLL